ncbi:ricin-type beta-trefoil lectin domain protein [Streptomyces sp. MAR4 CNX-425]|uniref:ricin-type beta-trefoil lectin domain protein n=1 Tax=Streptomyces sp. MAR4 CNX-425 TaxID=3406343 RepID=UPI003B514086
MFRAMRRVAVFVAMIAFALTVAAPPAQAGETPGTYSHWNFDGTTGLSDVAYGVTVEQHPGQQSQIYWSNQVSWVDGPGGYAGMQTNARADSNLFLFSVWDTSEARPGSEGSWCLRFGGEGEGMSCRMWHKWTPGHTYRFHYRAEGSGWWGMTVTDTATGSSFKLGSIRVGSDRMSPSSVSWVEYYRWSDSRSSCQTEPYSRARFDAPTGNDGTVTARLSGTKANTCPGFPDDGAAVTAAGSGARHTLGIGNSVMGPITGAADKCADVASDGSVVLWSCHGGGNQAWVMSQDGAIRAKDFSCLDIDGAGTADGTRVISWDCHARANQQWRAENGALVNPATGKCLDTENGATADGTRLVIRTCDGSATQRWTAPARP